MNLTAELEMSGKDDDTTTTLYMTIWKPKNYIMLFFPWRTNLHKLNCLTLYFTDAASNEEVHLTPEGSPELTVGSTMQSIQKWSIFTSKLSLWNYRTDMIGENAPYIISKSLTADSCSL